MSDINEEAKVVSGVYGGVTTEGCENVEQASNLPAKQGIWPRFKAFLFQEIDWNKEIKVELTPYQQKVEEEKEKQRLMRFRIKNILNTIFFC